MNRYGVQARISAVLLTTVILGACGGEGASADDEDELGARSVEQGQHEGSGYAHWGRFRWNAGSYVHPLRGFVLLDRTGDARAEAALREIVDAWNGDISRRGLSGKLPIISYLSDPGQAGACGPNMGSENIRERHFERPGYSVLLACAVGTRGHIGMAATLGAVTPDGAPYHYGTGFVPWVAVDPSRALVRGNRELLGAFAHEIGHALGLGHRRDCSLMDTSGCGWMNGRYWFDEHDFAALKAIYSHPDD